MDTISFDTQGLKVTLKDPIYDSSDFVCVISVKLDSDDEFFKCKYDMENQMLIFGYARLINRTHYSKIVVPADIAQILNREFKLLITDHYRKISNQDIQYSLYDTSNGIYNENHTIKIMLLLIQKQMNCNFHINIFEVIKKLNKDPEIIDIAHKTYKPYPIDPHWDSKYRKIQLKKLEDGTAEGFGVIPNKIIEKKIYGIVLDLINKSEKNLKNKHQVNSTKRKNSNQKGNI